MARLIDADALVDAIKNRIEEDREIYPNFSRFSRVGMRIVISIIKKQDTVDPAKHGEWINRSPLGTAICSICGYCADSVYTDRYCRHCGARMDGVEK